MAAKPIVFSDTTNKNGHIQNCEFWCGMNDGQISGDATLLKVFTARINAGFDRVMPYLYSFADYLKWDDTNNTDLPVGTFNIVSGQSDNKIATDDNSLDILDIVAVKILGSSSATNYTDIDIVGSEDDDAITAMSPNSTQTGTPTKCLKRGNILFLYPQPNYSVSAGVKIFFEREASYFVSTDTTKEAGIPRPCQELLSLYASYDWLIVHKPENQMLITRLESQIAKKEKFLQDMITARYPRKTIISVKYVNFR